jgi:hypothetical protein
MSHSARDPTPTAGSAMAKRQHVEQMGQVSEVEPGVLEVITRTGQRLRWVQTAYDWWRLCDGEISNTEAA